MSINRNFTIITLDSRDDINLPQIWLPGGTMTVLQRRLVNLVAPNSEKTDELGRWRLM